MRAALIWNPGAGQVPADDELRRLRAELARSFAVSVLVTSAARDARTCARDALSAGADVVLAAGGDGTVSAVAATLVGTRTPLGIVPRGTANSIAGGLGIPSDLPGALEVIREGRVRAIDTARANGRTMLLHAALGFHAATIGQTSRDAKSQWGVLAYVAEGLEQLRALEPFTVELQTDGDVIRCRATNVTVANIAPQQTLLAHGPSVVSPDDGLLDVTIVTVETLGEAVAMGLHLLRTTTQGEAAQREGIGYFSAPRIRVRAEPAQPLLVDGEPAGEGALQVECLPRSLHVLTSEHAASAAADGAQEEKLAGLPDLHVQRHGRA